MEKRTIYAAGRITHQRGAKILKKPLNISTLLNEDSIRIINEMSLLLEFEDDDSTACMICIEEIIEKVIETKSVNFILSVRSNV